MVEARKAEDSAEAVSERPALARKEVLRRNAQEAKRRLHRHDRHVARGRGAWDLPAEQRWRAEAERACEKKKEERKESR